MENVSIWFVLPDSYLLPQITALKELFDVEDALRFYRLSQPGFLKILPLNQKCMRRVNRIETTRGQGLCWKQRPPA